VTKENLIRQFLEQLKQKDDHYVKALKKENDDIDAIIAAMREQFNDMREHY
jgi:DnaJ-domain-containing protein 1